MTVERTGAQRFASVLGRAEDNLWNSFEQAREFAQRGDIGDVREDALTHFLRQRLPGRFAVSRGEVIDTAGTQSSQTDILIYDASSTVPLIELSRGNVLLAAESVLASVEVKSTLTKGELEKAAKGVCSLHALRPWDAPFGVLTGPQGARTDDALPRIMTSIFAYKSDLKDAGWAKSELTRIRATCAAQSLPIPCLDRVVVLDRGLINPAAGKALLAAEKGIVGDWFFNLMNFLAREAPRRRAFPWKDYHHSTGHRWATAGSPAFDAPTAARATTTQRVKARKRRNATS